MNYRIREIKDHEYSLLSEFLYEAIFIPDGVTPPPKNIITLPELQVYIKDFGKAESDKGMAAEIDGKIVGAAWVRIMNDYGHVDNDTPSLAISVYKEYRGLGIGTALLTGLLSILKINGYSRVSLAVQKENYAVKLYQKVGFYFFGENEQEYIMAADLTKNQTAI